MCLYIPLHICIDDIHHICIDDYIHHTYVHTITVDLSIHRGDTIILSSLFYIHSSLPSS